MTQQLGPADEACVTDELSQEDKERIILAFKRVYDESDANTNVRENSLYVVLFAGVLCNSLEHVNWALDRGANPQRNMPPPVRAILQQVHLI
tara:strand:+ start:301 stop:576 length:276 start_codon:yes stop_codon:yes gene_type:complete